MDINQVITLGVGTPSDITRFVLTGIGPASLVIVVSQANFLKVTIASRSVASAAIITSRAS